MQLFCYYLVALLSDGRAVLSSACSSFSITETMFCIMLLNLLRYMVFCVHSIYQVLASESQHKGSDVACCGSQLMTWWLGKDEIQSMIFPWLKSLPWAGWQEGHRAC